MIAILNRSKRILVNRKEKYQLSINLKKILNTHRYLHFILIFESWYLFAIKIIKILIPRLHDEDVSTIRNPPPYKNRPTKSKIVYKSKSSTKSKIFYKKSKKKHIRKKGTKN